MLRVLLVLVLLLQGPGSVSFDSNKAWEHLRQLVALGSRPAGSAAIEQSRTYIKNQLSASGIAVTEQAWEDQTPTGRVHMVNLIATIPGASKNRLVIGGHGRRERIRGKRLVVQKELGRKSGSGEPSQGAPLFTLH
jgi:hypothetical protein